MTSGDLAWRLVYGPPWDDGGFLWNIQDDMAVVWEELEKAGIVVSVSDMVTLIVGGLGLDFLDVVLSMPRDLWSHFPMLPKLSQRTVVALKQEVLPHVAGASTSQARAPRPSAPEPFSAPPTSRQAPLTPQPANSVLQSTSSTTKPQGFKSSGRWLVGVQACDTRRRHGPAAFRLAGAQEVSANCQSASCESSAVKLAHAKCGVCGLVLCGLCWGYGDNKHTLIFLNPSKQRRKASRAGLGRGAGGEVQ